MRLLETTAPTLLRPQRPPLETTAPTLLNARAHAHVQNPAPQMSGPRRPPAGAPPPAALFEVPPLCLNSSALSVLSGKSPDPKPSTSACSSRLPRLPVSAVPHLQNLLRSQQCTPRDPSHFFPARNQRRPPLSYPRATSPPAPCPLPPCHRRSSRLTLAPAPRLPAAGCVRRPGASCRGSSAAGRRPCRT